MIDSVLKGTGNSRFLKSAVPAGTSWADALAMLQAGTFPVDFNGINTEGFQQVGTPLNKANLLKDATAAQIGLPPSTTPDGMFQALGNTGELHVWRKTVKNAADVPAGYTLEAAQSNLHVPTAGQSIDFVFSASITVGDDGTVSQPSSDWKSVYATDTYVSVLQSLLAGKFFTTRSIYATGIEGVWYCPSNLTVSVSDNDIILSQAQKVNAHGIIPAGTTTTYPVSTNPKAYQEGDDAKAAGYVVGEVVTGDFVLGQANASDAYLFYKASSPTVSDDGTIEFDKSHYIQIGYAENWTASTLQAAIRGQFLQRGDYMNLPSNYVPAGTIYIPNDAVVTRSNDNYIVSKYQPVTGYAAIPAGTTIEYLGKLGDKARVQVVSYVGTGTYGSAHPTTVAFDIVPKIIFIAENVNYQPKIMTIVPSTLGAFGVYLSGGSVYGLNSPDVTITGKRISFFSSTSSGYQMNDTGKKYFAIAIG